MQLNVGEETVEALASPGVSSNAVVRLQQIAESLAEVDHALPLGLAEPPALSPAVIASIGETCGNFSGWRPFPAEELARRYGSRADYLKLARDKAAELVRAGYLLDEDEAAAIRQAEAQLPSGFR